MNLAHFRFAMPPDAPRQTEAELAAAIAALPMPETWTITDDARLMEALFRGLGIPAIADQLDQRDGNVRERFNALKCAAVGNGPLMLDDQTRLLNVTRQRARTVA